MKLLLSGLCMLFTATSVVAQDASDTRRLNATLAEIHSVIHGIHEDSYDFVRYYDLVQEVATRDISREDAIVLRGRWAAAADARIAHFRALQEGLEASVTVPERVADAAPYIENRAHLIAMVEQFDSYHRYWDDLIGAALDRVPETRRRAQAQMRGQLLALAIAYQDLIQSEIDNSVEGSPSYWYHTTVFQLFHALEEFNGMLFNVFAARGLPQRQLQAHYRTELAAIIGNGKEALIQLRKAVAEGDPPLAAAYQDHIPVLEAALERTGTYTIGFLTPADPINAVDELNHLLAIEDMILKDHAFRLKRFEALAEGA